MRGKIGEIIIKFGVQKLLTPSPSPRVRGEGSQINARNSAIMNGNMIWRFTFAAYSFCSRFVRPPIRGGLGVLFEVFRTFFGKGCPKPVDVFSLPNNLGPCEMRLRSNENASVT